MESNNVLNNLSNMASRNWTSYLFKMKSCYSTEFQALSPMYHKKTETKYGQENFQCTGKYSRRSNPVLLYFKLVLLHTINDN